MPVYLSTLTIGFIATLYYELYEASKLPWDDPYNPKTCVYKDDTAERRSHCSLMWQLGGSSVMLLAILMIAVNVGGMIQLKNGRIYFFGCQMLGMLAFILVATMIDLKNVYRVAFYGLLADKVSAIVGWLLGRLVGRCSN